VLPSTVPIFSPCPPFHIDIDKGAIPLAKKLENGLLVVGELSLFGSLSVFRKKGREANLEKGKTIFFLLKGFDEFE